MSQERSTLEKIADVVDDILDIVGLGTKIVNDVSNVKDEISQGSLMKSAKDRADQIRTQRKNKAS